MSAPMTWSVVLGENTIAVFFDRAAAEHFVATTLDTRIVELLPNCTPPPPTTSKVAWIITEGNSPDDCGDGEFGVEVDGIPYLYYKWDEPMPSAGVKYRRIGKREFGEVIRKPVTTPARDWDELRRRLLK